MKTNENFDLLIRREDRSADRTTWKAIAATLICAGVALLLLVGAKSASQVFSDPAQMMDPPIAQTEAEPEATQYAKAPPVERMGN